MIYWKRTSRLAFRSDKKYAVAKKSDALGHRLFNGSNVLGILLHMFILHCSQI